MLWKRTCPFFLNEAMIRTNETTPLKPSEIIGIVAATMLKESETSEVVYLEGIYQQRNYQRWAYCYDILRDPEGSEEITLKMSWDMRKKLTQGHLVTVGGLLNRSVTEKGQIQLRLDVTRVMGQKVLELSETEAEKNALLKKKRDGNHKNVDWFLEDILYKEERPKVAILIATGSITMSDFESTLNASARAAIDFVEIRTNISNCKDFCGNLAVVDSGNYSAAAIVRGGGEGIEKLDEIEVLRAVLAMKTPTISAIGHAEERLVFKQIVDKEVATPTALGQYFSDLCERVAERKTQSKAVMREQLQKQLSKQYEERTAELEKKLSEKDRAAIEWASEKARLLETQKFQKRDMENAQQQMKSLEESKMALLTTLDTVERAKKVLQKQMEEERVATSKMLNANTRKLKHQERTAQGLLVGLVAALIAVVILMVMLLR